MVLKILFLRQYLKRSRFICRYIFNLYLEEGSESRSMKKRMRESEINDRYEKVEES